MVTEANGDSIKPVAAGLPRKTLNVRPAGAPETTTLGGIDLFETLARRIP